MEVVAINGKYQVAIPQVVRDQMGLHVGDLLEARLEDGKLTLTPRPTIEHAIAEGLEDIKKGRVYGPFDTVDEMLVSLKGGVKKRARKPRRR